MKYLVQNNLVRWCRRGIGSPTDNSPLGSFSRCGKRVNGQFHHPSVPRAWFSLRINWNCSQWYLKQNNPAIRWSCFVARYKADRFVESFSFTPPICFLTLSRPWEKFPLKRLARIKQRAIDCTYDIDAYEQGSEDLRRRKPWKNTSRIDGSKSSEWNKSLKMASGSESRAAFEIKKLAVFRKNSILGVPHHISVSEELWNRCIWTRLNPVSLLTGRVNSSDLSYSAWFITVMNETQRIKEYTVNSVSPPPLFKYYTIVIPYINSWWVEGGRDADHTLGARRAWSYVFPACLSGNQHRM